jgi:hypothetical protein
MMQRAAMAAGLVILGAYPVEAQETTTKDCFSIIAPVGNSPMPYTMKLNRCDGSAWILVKVSTRKSKDGSPVPYAFRWFPIQHDVAQEAEIGP